MNKLIRFSGHAADMMRHRGALEQEVVEAIQTATWGKAERGRLECRKDFPCGREWNGRHYEQKQVRPVFAEEDNEIVVITVYVYYH